MHITALPGDYYHFDPAKQRLTGERSGRSFQLGGAVRVQVARVGLDDRKIDLEMVEDKSSGSKSKKTGTSQAKGKSTKAKPANAKSNRGKKKPKSEGGASNDSKAGGDAKARRKTGLRRHH